MQQEIGKYRFFLTRWRFHPRPRRSEKDVVIAAPTFRDAYVAVQAKFTDHDINACWPIYDAQELVIRRERARAAHWKLEDY